MGTRAGKIAVIMSRFPHLPETFILREMEALHQKGLEIVPYPLIFQPDQPVIHEEARVWLERARVTPFLSREVLAANGRLLIRQPKKGLALLWRTIVENAHEPGFLLRALIILPQAVRSAEMMVDEGIDHIHAHYASHPAFAAWIIHQLTAIPYSVTVHAHDIFVKTPMLASKLGDASFIVAISQYNRQVLQKHLGEAIDHKVHVIHCGVQPHRYENRAARKAGEDRPFEILNIGSLQPYKGQQYLIAACALLRDQGFSFHCTIIGEGSERPHLEAQIVTLGLQEQVTLAGPKSQEEVARLLPNADCYVQPSIVTYTGKMEGIPVALMEAMTCQVPVIASDLSGIPELVRHMQTGLLVPPGDAAVLAATIESLQQDPGLAARLGRGGQILAMDEYNLERNAAQLIVLFNLDG